MSERDKLLGHAADNDGIDEFDNPMPTWWIGLLWCTIAFAIVYGVEYHFVSNRSQVKAYETEVAAHEAALAAAPTPKTGAAEATPASADAGKAVYMANCLGCHGPDLKGGVGPDLTDAVWIHGGSLEQINHTVTVGVPEKGMLTWGPILGPEKISQVSAYVHAAGGGQ